MKTLVCIKPTQFEYREMEEPVLAEGQTILKIKRVGICGTDLHAFNGTQPFFNYPRILGHELSAEIKETTAKDFIKGDAVTIIPYFNCGNCIACRNGKPNCCVSMNVCGVHVDGGMREFLSVPTYSLVHNEGLTDDELAMTEPLAIAVHAVKRAAIKKDEHVLIIGAGPIGLAVAAFAQIAGANVMMVDVNEQRLLFCTNKLKIQFVLNPVKDDMMERLKMITGNDMPTVLIDATGNLNAINNAFQWLAHGGRYILVGLQKENISFSHPEFHKREATLMSSRWRTEFL